MKEWVYKFFSSAINADWAVAFTTLLLVGVTILFYFIDDNYTRLLKNSEKFKFYNLAFDFLRTSYASWSPGASSPTLTSQTVAEHIDTFRQKLIENKIYMGWRDKCRFNRYVKLAQKLATAWSVNDIKVVNKHQINILSELKWLAQKLGREVEYTKLKK